MIQIIQSIMLVLIYLAVYYVFGFNFIKCFKERTTHHNPILVGMFVYAIIFFILAFPMKIMLMPLDIVGWCWLALLLVVLLVTGIRWHKDIREDLGHRLNWMKNHWGIVIGIAVLGIVELLIVELQPKLGSPWDAAYYIGEVSTAVHDNIMGVTDPIMGTPLSSFSILYVLETYLMHSAVMCKLTHIAPIIESKMIMTAIVLIIFNLILWEIGKYFFKEIGWKIITFMAGVFVVCLFSQSIFWPGSFLINRTFEGKAILANLIIPAMLLLCMKLYQKPKAYYWAALFCVITASFTYSMSSMFITPVFLLGYMVVLMISKRSVKILVGACISMIPCVIIMFVYLLSLKGYIVWMIQ